MTDLGCSSPSREITSASLLLFGDAHAAHWKLPKGSVIMAKDAKVLASESSAGAKQSFAYSVSRGSDIVEIGAAADFGSCSSPGCFNVLNTRWHTDVCSMHLAQKMKALVANRMQIGGAAAGGRASALVMRRASKNQHLSHGEFKIPAAVMKRVRAGRFPGHRPSTAGSKKIRRIQVHIYGFGPTGRLLQQRRMAISSASRASLDKKRKLEATGVITRGNRQFLLAMGSERRKKTKKEAEEDAKRARYKRQAELAERRRQIRALNGTSKEKGAMSGGPATTSSSSRGGGSRLTIVGGGTNASSFSSNFGKNVDVDAILKASSAHAGAAAAERAEVRERVLDRLQEQEELSERMKTITSIKVVAFK